LLGSGAQRLCLSTCSPSFGCFVALELSTGSRVGRAGTLAIDVGAVISAAIPCFDIIPSTALKLWRMKPGGVAADGYAV
ncbi:hypothetical protein BAE44_0005065, partial [Dichanthelium oligosanthes]